MLKFESVANHLDFLNALRGKVSLRDSFALVESERPEFTFAYQLRPEAELSSDASQLSQLYLFKTSPQLKQAATKQGFEASGSIMHMEFSGQKAIKSNHRTDLIIREVKTASEMELFGEVQSRSFLTTDAAYAEWAPFLKKMNQRNLGNPDQRYLIAYENGIPVAVTLEVIRPDCVGIYAVATFPKYRKKGASSTLLHHTLETYPDRMVCLQVQAASYAHGFYSSLGFQDVLEIEILRRSSASSERT